MGIYVASATLFFLEMCLFAIIRNINITVSFYHAGPRAKIISVEGVFTISGTATKSALTEIF